MNKLPHSVLKNIFEFGPIVLFFIVYSWIKNDEFIIFSVTYTGFIVATALFIPIFLLATLALWWITGELSKLQILTAVLIIVFGGLSVVFNDERFFKIKPTLLYLLLAGTIGVGLFQGKSYLQYVLGDAFAMEERGWMILTKRFMIFFFVLALLNEIIWRTQTTDIWVNFKIFGFPIAMIVFMITQILLISKYTDKTS